MPYQVMGTVQFVLMGRTASRDKLSCEFCPDGTASHPGSTHLKDCKCMKIVRSSFLELKFDSKFN